MKTKFKSRKLTVALMGAGAMLLFTGAALADQVFNNKTWMFEGGAGPTKGPDWGSTDFTMVGAPGYVVDPGEGVQARLRLTDNNFWQNGSAWLNTSKIDVAASWDVWFRGELTYPAVSGADGMGIVFQTQGTGANSSAPPNYYQGFTNPFLSIDLCSYAGSPTTDAMRVFLNGTIIGTIDVSPALESTNYFNLEAKYNSSTHQLQAIFTDDTVAWNKTLTLTTDLGAAFGSNHMTTFGFTGATGADAENHDILQAGIVNANPVPEPSSLALAGLSLLGSGMLAIRRRRK